jgi:hypothetical protein
MNDMTPALRGLRWAYMHDRISLPTLERKVQHVLALEAREPAPVSELVSVSKVR